ncbi:MAG: rRNA (guanine527-N7)-methyltransferase [Patescibacteria group bacterium]|nr:rRNA (guanine527-N7)-methyltransferase [Patescibacteria group bacterium]
MVQEIFSQFGISAPPEKAALFERYADLFLAYNAHTNLSAIRDREGVVTKHFADSAMLLNFEPLRGRMLDLGTGGGFPGIPLKILVNELSVTLLDSVSKKTKACDHFIAELGLSNVRTVWGRAEDVVKIPGMRSSFDAVVSRATAYMPQVLEWAAPFVRVGGSIMLYKLPSEEELADGLPMAEKLGFELAREHAYSFLGQERRIFVFVRRK